MAYGTDSMYLYTKYIVAHNFRILCGVGERMRHLHNIYDRREREQEKCENIMSVCVCVRKI